jgi:hypothetical protein
MTLSDKEERLHKLVGLALYKDWTHRFFALASLSIMCETNASKTLDSSYFVLAGPEHTLSRHT